MTSRLFPFVPLIIFIATLGCGNHVPEEGGPTSEFSIEIDPTLPKDLAAKQRAIHSILSTILEGLPPEQIKFAVSGIKRFDETREAFLEGEAGLLRWGFNGRPEGDGVSVILSLATKSPSQLERKVERVYLVKGTPGQFLVSPERMNTTNR